MRRGCGEGAEGVQRGAEGAEGTEGPEGAKGAEGARLDTLAHRTLESLQRERVRADAARLDA